MTIKNIHIIRGNDSFSIELHIQNIIKKLGTDFDVSMNLSRLDGKLNSLEELSLAVTSLPFFGTNRLVVVSNAAALIEKPQQEKNARILDSAPESTHLVLIIEDRLKWRKDDAGKWQQYWELLNPEHWLVKWASAHENAEIARFPTAGRARYASLGDPRSQEAGRAILSGCSRGIEPAYRQRHRHCQPGNRQAADVCQFRAR